MSTEAFRSLSKSSSSTTTISTRTSFLDMSHRSLDRDICIRSERDRNRTISVTPGNDAIPIAFSISSVVLSTFKKIKFDQEISKHHFDFADIHGRLFGNKIHSAFTFFFLIHLLKAEMKEI